MCGIAGIVKFNHSPPVPPPALDAMLDALAHRGPDGRGIWIDPRPDKTAALLHRRLAIIDLPCGKQPMANEDGGVQVIFNGEIYNHAELRRELERLGHRFASDHSDTEVLVHGWEQWEIDLPSKLRGMFAFAIFDARPDPSGQPRDTLFLARDRMGQKPLFYASLEDGLVFGSTIGSILAWPEVPRRFPREQLGLYLLLGYIPAPQTIWRDISQVVPGGWVRLCRDILDGGIYWRKSHETVITRLEEAVAQLRTAVPRAVESQMIADVPIACFLSGGIDSSITAALMQKAVMSRGGPPITTVSVGFAESAFDETAFAAAVAAKIGSRHVRLEVRPDDGVLDTLRSLMRRSLGQPFADSSILPTHQLSKAVRQIAPVALSGDGADELFGGYDRYRAMALLQKWRLFTQFLPRWAPAGSLRKKERYLRLTAAARANGLAESYTRLLEITPRPLVEELLGDVLDFDHAPLAEEFGFRPQTHVWAPHYAMARDQADYLPGDVLWKVDAASMLEALEVRSPFLDHEVVELANRIDPRLHLASGGSKFALKQAFADLLPPEVFRRGKKGFAAPVGEWFKTTLRPALHDLLEASNSFSRQHLKTPVVQRLLNEHEAGARDHTHRLFALLMLEVWAREFQPSAD